MAEVTEIEKLDLSPPACTMRQPWMCKTIYIVSFSYLILLAILLLAFRFVGESHPFTGSLLYLPPQVWTIPAFLILPFTLCVRRRLTALLVLTLAWFYLLYLNPEFNRWLPATDDDIVVLTCNRGQTHADALRPLVATEQPDIIALQEANGFYDSYREQFPKYMSSGVDEFLIFSKLPIRESDVVELQTLHRGLPCAGRFLMEKDGKTFVLYNVHLPTPREFLRQNYEQPSMLIPLPKDQARGNILAYWKNRVDMVQELQSIIAKETLPVIVVGDFNMASYGKAYQIVSEDLQDSHDARGRGYGFTFPADTRWPLGWLGPWLRLDYAFASDEWEVIFNRVEKRRKAQHRALVTGFRLSG